MHKISLSRRFDHSRPSVGRCRPRVVFRARDLEVGRGVRERASVPVRNPSRLADRQESKVVKRHSWLRVEGGAARA